MGHAENFYLENFSLAGVVGESIVFESGNPLNYFEAIEAPHQQGKVHARVSIDFKKEFNKYLFFKTKL